MSSRIKGEHWHLLPVNQILCAPKSCHWCYSRRRGRVAWKCLWFGSFSGWYLYWQGCLSFICWSTVTVILYITVTATSCFHKQKAALNQHTHTVEWWMIVMQEFFWWNGHGLWNFLTSALEALMFLSVKNTGWAHTSLWDLYFVESEDIKSKYSSIELLIHEAIE